MNKKIGLWLVITVIFTLTLIVTNTALYTFLLKENSATIEVNETKRLFAEGKQLAREPIVIEALKKGDASPELSQYTDDFQENYGIDFAVVMTMEGIRLTHPNKEKIGEHFEGGDELPALKGEAVSSINRGTLGTSLRILEPVYNKKQQQIGVVALGIKLSTLDTIVNESQRGFKISLLSSILLAGVISVFIAYLLKKQLHNLKPWEISSLLEERNAMLNESKDIVIVLDKKNRITLVNIATKEFAKQNGINTEYLLKQHLDYLLTHLDQIDLAVGHEQIYQQAGQDYLFSISPIIVRQKRIGSIIFLRNATESKFVTDQLANTTAYASALQTQSHEFMNKLHVIYGLTDLKAYDELTIYLSELLIPEQEFSNRLAILCHNPLFASFLIGERERFSECKAQLTIELLSEIPNLEQDQDTIHLINVIRYIHHTLLKLELPEFIFLNFEQQTDRLFTTYECLEEQQIFQSLIIALEEPYFHHLIEIVDGEFNLIKEDNRIHLTLMTYYKGE
ncbi:sensor histidine kinase [Vagococcus jeotgali]|uniref:sensor histidine kinase n=1 Tax=Vagococcus jeotgali TaxID=3109030 RepID=UPI002DD8F67C|nr:sensor histidine kinase [Vagococcus sp. B2T-5]